MQHILTIMENRGRTGVVLQDNVLFFDKQAPRAGGKPNTRALWVYDFRTNKNFTLKKSPLKRVDVDDFVACYGGARGVSVRSRRAGRYAYKG